MHYVLDGNVFKCVPVRKLIESKVLILLLLLKKRAREGERDSALARAQERERHIDRESERKTEREKERERKCVPVRKLIESKVPILFLLLRKRKCVCERVRERNR